MSDPRVRQAIARRAAQLMYAREESEYFTAKRKAAKEMGINPRFHPKDLPSNREIRDEIQMYAELLEGDTRHDHLFEMRVDALRLMRKLARFRPKLIGSVLTGHVRDGSDIDIHVFTDFISAVEAVLENEGLPLSVKRKQVTKHHVTRTYTHIHAIDRFEYELTVYSSKEANYAFKSSITGKQIENATIPQLEIFLRETYPAIDLEAEVEHLNDHIDPLELFRVLLNSLDGVKQNRQYHPEGDALYHSLQVFQLACDYSPWDEEMLLAALLHDVGKAIDPHDHVTAALLSLEGAVTNRTFFLIENHMNAHAYRDGTIGARLRKRLAASEYIEDLLLLSEFDKKGRQRGVTVPTVDQALAYLRKLANNDYSDC